MDPDANGNVIPKKVMSKALCDFMARLRLGNVEIHVGQADALAKRPSRGLSIGSSAVAVVSCHQDEAAALARQCYPDLFKRDSKGVDAPNGEAT